MVAVKNIWADLTNLEIEALKLDKYKVKEWFEEKDIPSHIVNYILKLYEHTKDVSQEVIHIGRIIILKIMDFIKENPNLSIGMALGAAAGFLAGSFMNVIPFVGNILQTIAIGMGMFIGAIAGYRLDEMENGKVVIDQTIFGVFGDAMQIAKKFFQMLVDIINTVMIQK
jgi:ElaB/YqjD/DUF883 family membrane-anchored ribosome-binding protein